MTTAGCRRREAIEDRPMARRGTAVVRVPPPTGGSAGPPRPWQPGPGCPAGARSRHRFRVLARSASGTDPLGADHAADVNTAVAHHASTGRPMGPCSATSECPLPRARRRVRPGWTSTGRPAPPSDAAMWLVAGWFPGRHRGATAVFGMVGAVLPRRPGTRPLARGPTPTHRVGPLAFDPDPVDGEAYRANRLFTAFCRMAMAAARSSGVIRRVPGASSSSSRSNGTTRVVGTGAVSVRTHRRMIGPSL